MRFNCSERQFFMVLSSVFQTCLRKRLKIFVSNARNNHTSFTVDPFMHTAALNCVSRCEHANAIDCTGTQCMAEAGKCNQAKLHLLYDVDRPLY